MTTLRLTYVPMENSEHVYLNGVEQRFGTDYVFSDPGVISTQTSMGVVSGDTLECYYAHQNELVPLPDEPTIVGNLTHLNRDYDFQFELPTGVEVGDLMIITTYHWHGCHLTTGFMDWYPNDGLGVRLHRVQAKFIDTEEAGDVIHVGVGSGWRGAGVMQIIRGVDPSDPLFDIGVGAAPTIATVTTDTDARKVVHMAVHYGGGGPITFSRGATTVNDWDVDLGAAASQEWATAGTTFSCTINVGWGASVVLRSD